MSISVEKAREKVKQNKNSIDAWNILIKDAQDKNIDETRDFFEDLISHFPTCGRFWKTYIEEELFERSLNNILSIDLWKCFLSYLKERKIDEPNFNEIMISAYDSALLKIGLDVMSYSIWIDYINFLKSLENNIENEEDKEKLYELIRSKYHAGLQNPMINIDQMWKDYCHFEIQINADNGKKIVEEISKEFQNIKKISREYENVTRPLERHLPSLALDQTTSDNDEDLRQLYAWKRYILWEKQNPLKLSNHKDIMRRVIFAYEQSFLCLAYHCDIWHEAALYLKNQHAILKDQNELIDEEIDEITFNAASDLYERAINTFMKNNILIHLAYADFEETRSNMSKVSEIYERCISNEQIDPTLAWIHYIMFVRRNEGVNSARKLFKRAREDNRITYHLFIANAILEYFCTKDKTIGFRILHLGAKRFSNEPEYMLAFIKYMSHLNEDNNTRVLFERILTSEDLPSYKTNEIWSEFLKFECAVGDLASILKVDKKRQKVFETLQNNQTSSEMTECSLMIDRYRYLDLLPCSINELKSMGYKDSRLNLQNTSQTTNPSIMSNLSTIFSNNVSISQAELAVVAANELKRAKLPIPDTNQMLPFKPIRNVLPGMMHSIAGGVFPFPPSVTELVKRLPPPNAFEGPFVIIDELIKKFQEVEIPEDFQAYYIYPNGEPIKEFEHLSTVAQTNVLQTNIKRSMLNGDGSDEEDVKKTKTMDIYKQRQYKKLIQK